MTSITITDPNYLPNSLPHPGSSRFADPTAA